jgi:hypothetical protein
MTRFFTNFFAGIFLSAFLSTNASALEITDYSISITGIFHRIVVAFDSLDKRAVVRCVITKNSKPVGMETQLISGVGTIEIYLPGGILGTQASCVEKK